MRLKQMISALLVALLLLFSALPSAATDSLQDALPSFTIDLREDGLYGTLSYIPEDAQYIDVYWSVAGQANQRLYVEGESAKREWDLTAGKDALRTQLCAGLQDHPIKSYLEKKIATIDIMLVLIKENGTRVWLEPATLSQEILWNLPEEPPEFSARVLSDSQGYSIQGTFTDIPPTATNIQPLYSLDDKEYSVISEDDDWRLFFSGDDSDNTQRCAYSNNEPLKSYLAETLDRFYVKLAITVAGGETYYTQVATIDRNVLIPAPEGTETIVCFAPNMRIGRPPHGQYQLTAVEGTTWEGLRAFLPEAIPMQVNIILPDGTMSLGFMECRVDWKLPDRVIEEGENLLDAVVVHIPENPKVKTYLGIFQLNGTPTFDAENASNQLHLVPNLVEEGAEPSGVLDTDMKINMGVTELSVAFYLKPTGATAIHTYTYGNEDKEWTELSDVPLLEAVNSAPKLESTGYVTVLRENQGHFQAYSEGKIEGFLVGIKIEGGIYDGKIMTLKWPGDYNGPQNPPELGGSGGNENNAGSGGGNGGNGEDGGQRPDLPDEKPPITLPPIEKPNPPGKDKEPIDHTLPTELPTLPESGDGTDKLDASTQQNSGKDESTTKAAGKKQKLDKIETTGDSGAEQEMPIAQDRVASNPLEKDNEGTSSSPVWKPTDQQETPTEELKGNKPPRAAEELRFSTATAGLLIIGGVAARGMATRLKGRIMDTEAFGKLIAVIKHFLKRF